MKGYFRFYIKMAFMPFIYLLFSAMLGVGILLIKEESLIVLKYVLCIVNTLFYAGIMGMAAFKDGEKAIKVREQNDTYRRVIAQTGDDLPLNLPEEYTPWKGLVISLISCIPSVLLVVIHLLLNIGAPTDSYLVGGAAGIMNIVVFSYFMLDGITVWEYAFVLLIVPFICLVYGLMYNLGAKKMQKQYDRIAQTQKQIHGE